MYKQNSSGLNEHPCFTPMVLGKSFRDLVYYLHLHSVILVQDLYHPDESRWDAQLSQGVPKLHP